MALPKILIISLGGTIAMTGDGKSGIRPTLSAADLIGTVPGLTSHAEIDAVSLLQVPGASLTLDELIRLAGRIDHELAAGASGVVVVQGTDTIEETAFALDLLVSRDGAVVVTGAMRGAQAAGADGPANLLAAVTVAADPRSAGMGALVVLNDQVHAARFVQKSHTALTSAFGSPSAGPVGLVAEGSVHFQMRVARGPHLTNCQEGLDRPVALVTLGLGDDGRMLPALSGLGYGGTVLAAMGVGHVPASMVSMIRDLSTAMPVVLATRVAAGPTFTQTYGFPGSEIDLLSAGLLPAGHLSALKARLLLMLGLRQNADRNELEKNFRSYATRHFEVVA